MYASHFYAKDACLCLSIGTIEDDVTHTAKIFYKIRNMIRYVHRPLRDPSQKFRERS